MTLNEMKAVHKIVGYLENDHLKHAASDNCSGCKALSLAKMLFAEGKIDDAPTSPASLR